MSERQRTESSMDGDHIPLNQRSGGLGPITTTYDELLHHESALTVPTGFFEIFYQVARLEQPPSRDEKPFSLIPQWQGSEDNCVVSWRGACGVRRRPTGRRPWLGPSKISCSRSRLERSFIDFCPCRGKNGWRSRQLRRSERGISLSGCA